MSWKLREERAEGIAAMGEFPLLGAGNFGEGEAERGDQKERVVAEAVRAAWRGEQHAVDPAARVLEDAAVAGHCELAGEAGGAGGIGQRGQQGEDAAVVARVFADG